MSFNFTFLICMVNILASFFIYTAVAGVYLEVTPCAEDQPCMAKIVSNGTREIACAICLVMAISIALPFVVFFEHNAIIHEGREEDKGGKEKERGKREEEIEMYWWCPFGLKKKEGLTEPLV